MHNIRELKFIFSVAGDNVMFQVGAHGLVKFINILGGIIKDDEYPRRVRNEFLPSWEEKYGLVFSVSSRYICFKTKIIITE